MLRQALIVGLAAICASEVTEVTNPVLYPDIGEKMRLFKIIPDLVPEPANDMCTVYYPPTNATLAARKVLHRIPDGFTIHMGSRFNEEDTLKEPHIIWEYYPKRYYTMCMTTPDGIKYEPPITWLVVNIPELSFLHAQNITNYTAPRAIVKDSRYVFLVYEQPGLEPIHFEEYENRKNFTSKGFSIVDFARKYNFGKLFAANFFLLRH